MRLLINLMKKMKRKTMSLKRLLPIYKRLLKNHNNMLWKKEVRPRKNKRNSKKKPISYKRKKWLLKNYLWLKPLKKKSKPNSWLKPNKPNPKRTSSNRPRRFSERLRKKKTERCLEPRNKCWKKKKEDKRTSNRKWLTKLYKLNWIYHLMTATLKN